MPDLPSGLKLKGTPASPRGRGLIAAAPVNPGGTIAWFSKPSIAIPDSPHLDQTCNYCLSLTAKVRACTGCRVVTYCGPKCQKADWGLVHSKECKIFRRVKAEGHDFLPTPVRALVQVLLRSDMLAALEELESHADKFREDRRGWSDFELQAMAALHYLGRDANPRSISNAIEILTKLQVNSFNRLDADIGQTGQYLSPALAMVNHSCLPNAFVQFTGRQAVLKAYRSIQPGDEIEISYIENNTHLAYRKKALGERYHFSCDCVRCKDDLDVYQVAQRSPHLELNRYSLVPGIDTFHKAGTKPLNSNQALLRNIGMIYPSCSGPLHMTGLDEKRQQLRTRWKKCRELCNAQLYAVEPLSQVLTEACVYFGEKGDFGFSLALACFLSLRSDPYRSPMPFGPQRVKGLLLIAKLLGNTAPGTSSVVGARAEPVLTAELAEGLAKLDQATMCQAVLEMVVQYSPLAHSGDWLVHKQAKDMLNDINSLPGREKEASLLKQWAESQDDFEAKTFVQQSVLQPVEKLASFAMDIMKKEFD